MPFQWTEEFSVGVQSIDDQHKVLIGLINEAEAACWAKPNPERFGKVVRGILDYAQEHFRYEEGLFLEHGFPDRVEHEGQHLSLFTKAFELEQKIADGTVEIGCDLFDFLNRWLRIHILLHDKEGGKFLASRGVK